MSPILSIAFSEDDFAVTELHNHIWSRANAVAIDLYWSGRIAPAERCFEARLIWSKTSLYVRFDAVQNEPLIVSAQPNLETKTVGLWERDVCEIFIAPDRKEPRKYFEFEAAPTGEWLDLAIDTTGGKRKADWEYKSGMQTAARIQEGRVLIALQIPWAAFGTKPNAGDIWLGNIFRCVGKTPNRGYLAWVPTMTEKPNFHVPSAFGKFEFGIMPNQSETCFTLGETKHAG